MDLKIGKIIGALTQKFVVWKDDNYLVFGAASERGDLSFFEQEFRRSYKNEQCRIKIVLGRDETYTNWLADSGSFGRSHATISNIVGCKGSPLGGGFVDKVSEEGTTKIVLQGESGDYGAIPNEILEKFAPLIKPIYFDLVPAATELIISPRVRPEATKQWQPILAELTKSATELHIPSPDLI